MRDAAGAILAVLLLASAGCVGGSHEADVETTGDASAALPGPIADEQHVEVGADPLDSAQQGGCEENASACYAYPFQVGEDARVQAHLDWANATNDFDLHVVDGDDERVASSSDGPLETEESIDAEVPAGSYELVVVAWIASSETFALEAHFGYA